MAAFDVLRSYLEARASFTGKDIEFMRSVFVRRSLSAGEFLQRAGDVSKYAAFIAAGCLRSYVIDAQRKEHIVQCELETWWRADATSRMKRTPCQYFIDAIEASDVMLIDGPSHQKVIDNVPGYGEAMRAGLQRHAAAKDQRIATALSASAEERYLDFLETYPSIVQRVPQLMLASYLGMTPETLSRIRKHLSRSEGKG